LNLYYSLMPKNFCTIQNFKKISHESIYNCNNDNVRDEKSEKI